MTDKAETVHQTLIIFAKLWQSYWLRYYSSALISDGDLYGSSTAKLYCDSKT